MRVLITEAHDVMLILCCRCLRHARPAAAGAVFRCRRAQRLSRSDNAAARRRAMFQAAVCDAAMPAAPASK